MSKRCRDTSNAVFHFMIRWSAPYTEASLSALKNFMAVEAKHWIFQAETTTRPDGTMNPHYQGYLQVGTKLRVGTLIKRVNDAYPQLRGMEVQPTHNHEAVKKYSMKSSSRVAGPWADRAIYMGADLPPEGSLYPWQASLLSDLKMPPGDRKMLWIYDAVGNKGKTKFAKFLCYHMNAICLGYAHSTDALNMVFNNQNRRIYVWNLTRAKPATLSEYDLYSAMESVKDGLFFNSKYNTGQCIMNCPHVVVFANKLPEYGQISADRWKVLEIKEDLTLDRLVPVSGAELVPESPPGHQGQPRNPPVVSAASRPRKQQQQPRAGKKTTQLSLVEPPLNVNWYAAAEVPEEVIGTEPDSLQPDCDFDGDEWGPDDFAELAAELQEANAEEPDWNRKHFDAADGQFETVDLTGDADEEEVAQPVKKKKKKCAFIDDEADCDDDDY